MLFDEEIIGVFDGFVNMVIKENAPREAYLSIIAQVDGFVKIWE